MKDQADSFESKTPEQLESSVLELSESVEEQGDLLYRFARYRVNSHELAEDLVQTTFISALKDWERFRRESSRKTWLVSILRHKIIDHYRRKKRTLWKIFRTAVRLLLNLLLLLKKWCRILNRSG